MLNTSLNQMQIEMIKNHLISRISSYLIILFGSAAKGNMRQDSDVDIAFLSNKQFGTYEIFIIAQELANTLGRDVDLIDLNKASTVFKAQIIGTGRIIHNNDDYRKCMFQIKAFKEYALLNEERKCVVDRLKERGFIYEQ